MQHGPVSIRYGCTRFVIQWIGNLMTGDPVTVGVMLFCESTGFSDLKFTEDARRLQRIEGSVNADFFEAFEEEFRARIADAQSRALFLSKVPDWASNNLQLSAPTAVLTDDPALEFARQVQTLLVAPVFSQTPERGASERERVRRAMRDVFIEYDLLKHLETKIAVSNYVSDDPLRFDYGYRTDTHYRIFHPAPVESDLEDAKALAFSYPAFADAVREKTSLQTQLTAVVEDYAWTPSTNRNFAYRAFNGSDIEAVTLSELPQRVLRARAELQL